MDETLDPGTLAQDLFYAGLRALRAAVPLDLSAYLHESAGHGPQLYLGTPDLASIEPNDAFLLFTSLRDALEEDLEPGADLSVGGFGAVAIPSRGPASRGLHVLGRRGSAPDDAERATILELTPAFASIGHALDAFSPPAPPEAPTQPAALARVSVEMVDGAARAEVAVQSGEELLGGTAEAVSAPRAVALAALDAMDSGIKLIEVTEGQIGGERATLVLVADDIDRLGLGSALLSEATDIVRAAALAALEAVQHLRGAHA